MGKVKRSKFNIDNLFETRPKVKDYELLSDEVKIYVDNLVLKANPELRLKRKTIIPKWIDFFQMRWIDLIELRFDFENENLTGVFDKVYGISEKQIGNLDLINFVAAIKWITNQLEDIAETEKENLTYESSAEEKEAGSEEFEKYDYYVTLDGLTNGDSTKEDFYLNKSYEYIFRKLCLLNDKRMFNDKMQEIVSRKNKRN